MEEIIIRKAELKDAKGISEIIDYWVEKGNNNDKKNGYLRNSLYTLTQIEEIITSGGVTVAVLDQAVCSFYLLNTSFHQDIIQERTALINDKIANNELPLGKYAVTLLSSTAAGHEGKRLNTKTLILLQELFQSEFDYLVGVMSYDNVATHKSSLKMGWRHFGDIGIGLLAIIGTTEEKNQILDTFTKP